jgi:hypothetical protein
MNPDLLAQASAAKQLLLDLKQFLETNTLDISNYVSRIKAELSQDAINVLTNAKNSSEVINTYLPVFTLFLDPTIIFFYQQPVVLQWLDLILNSLKKPV